MHDGGYETGYAACSCFWDQEPGSLVQRLFDYNTDVTGLRVLDAGCGEGKNAYALAERGSKVKAVDCSARAIETARIRFSHPAITWHVADVTAWNLKPESYDIIIAYGLLHCLATPRDIFQLVSRFQTATRPCGLNIICAFDDGPQDLSAHPGFTPTLLSYDDYVRLYQGWHLVTARSSLLYETHPHNDIPHHHSLTRLLAEKA